MGAHVLKPYFISGDFKFYGGFHPGPRSTWKNVSKIFFFETFIRKNHFEISEINRIILAGCENKRKVLMFRKMLESTYGIYFIFFTNDQKLPKIVPQNLTQNNPR